MRLPSPAADREISRSCVGDDVARNLVMRTLLPNLLDRVTGGTTAKPDKILVGPEFALKWLADRGLPLPK